jgi:hypothetical protein
VVYFKGGTAYLLGLDCSDFVRKLKVISGKKLTPKRPIRKSAIKKWAAELSWMAVKLSVR